jgi:hypothetical protein
MTVVSRAEDVPSARVLSTSRRWWAPPSGRWRCAPATGTSRPARSRDTDRPLGGWARRGERRPGDGAELQLRCRAIAAAAGEAAGLGAERRHGPAPLPPPQLQVLGVSSSQGLRVVGVRRIGWSCRPTDPTAGASTTTGMRWVPRWSAGPIPDSISSWSVLTAPQATTASRVAPAWRAAAPPRR